MTAFRHQAFPLVAVLAVAAAFVATTASAAPTCSARSAATVPAVVELYTSEGCNSCPPADRWLSSALKADPAVVALAFHVDYWDRLGWKDRFASAAYTQRQAQQQAVSGARFSYTPQVIVNGVDRPDWSRAATAAPGRAAPLPVELSGDGRRFQATIAATAGAPARLAAYWAVTEQRHVSAVKAGENEGTTLHHDAVVRQYQTVAAWDGRSAATFEFDVAGAPDPAHPREVNLVVVDAATGRPVQAVKLGC